MGGAEMAGKVGRISRDLRQDFPTRSPCRRCRLVRLRRCRVLQYPYGL